MNKCYCNSFTIARGHRCQNHARFSCAITCHPEQINYKVRHVVHVLVLIHTTLEWDMSKEIQKYAQVNIDKKE